MRNRYSTQDYNPSNMARVLGKDLGISTKKSIELCNFLRKKTTRDAMSILARVIAKKQAVPFKRFKMEIPHRSPGLGPGKYPIKVAREFIRLIKEVESNAQQKGLDTNNLLLKHMIANKASRPWHFGRQRRTKMKRTHIEIVVEEKKSILDKPFKKSLEGKEGKEGSRKSEEKEGKKQEKKASKKVEKK